MISDARLFNMIKTFGDGPFQSQVLMISHLEEWELPLILYYDLSYHAINIDPDHLFQKGD